MCAVFIAIKFYWPATYQGIIAEDAILEDAQVVFYALASLVALRAAWQFRLARMRCYAVAWVLLSVLLLIVAFEEVSWFERVTHVSVEAIKTRNFQGETNIHNLLFIQPYLHRSYIVVSAIAAFGWVVFPNGLVFPDRILCLYFLPLCLMYSYFEAGRLFNRGAFLFGSSVWRDQEPVETLMALGFLLHAVLVLYALKALSRQPRPAFEGASAAARP